MSERQFYITEITLYEEQGTAIEQLHKLLGDASDNVQIASVVATVTTTTTRSFRARSPMILDGPIDERTR